MRGFHLSDMRVGVASFEPFRGIGSFLFLRTIRAGNKIYIEIYKDIWREMQFLLSEFDIWCF